MNRKMWTSLALACALALAAGFAWAQEQEPPQKVKIMKEGPGLEGAPFGPAIELLGFEGMHGGKVVTGAPFSGVAVSETTQTLADGNHITRKTQTNLYRDSQGRFRKEVTIPGIGLLAEAGQPRTFIVIHDPVANVGFSLEPDQKVARKTHFSVSGNSTAFNNRIENRMQRQLAEGALQKEDLGTQTINGVVATGTRYTHTIPAGKIGNEKPITIVSERWYSNDLQLVVKSTRSDPRFGETTYALTNIQRAEPAASLFQVPSDYTVKEGRFPRRGGALKQGPPPPSME